MSETLSRPGIVFEVVYADGECVEPISAIHGDDLLEMGSEGDLDLIDERKAAIEDQLEQTDLAEELRLLKLGDYSVQPAVRIITDEEVQQINDDSVLNGIDADAEFPPEIEEFLATYRN